MNDYKIFTALLAVFILLAPVAVAPPAGEYSTVFGSGGNTPPTAGGDAGSQASAAPSPSPSPSSSPGSSGSSPAPAPAPAPSPAPAPTPSPAPTPVPVTPVEVPVTETENVAEIISSIDPAVLGVTEIISENVEVTKTGVAESTTPTLSPVLESVIEQVLPAATEAQSQQVLSEIRETVSSGSSAPVPVQTTLEVFEVREKTTGEVTHVSKITLTLKPDKDLKQVKIVEVIPKDVAASVSEITFFGEQPEVLQADPIVQWVFPEVMKDETRHLSYQVNKKIEALSANTVAVAQAPPAEAKPSMVWLYALIGIVVVVAAYLFYRNFASKPHPNRAR